MMTEQERRENGCDLRALEKERAAKQRRVQAMLHEQEFEGVVISRHENLAWLTAGVVDLRVGMLRETGPASVLMLQDGRAYYLTTNNEAARLGEEEFAGLGYAPVVQPWYANDVAGAVARLARGGRVATDSPVGGCEMVSLQALRYELEESEAARYRYVGRKAAEAATEVLHALRPGMSERMIQAMLAGRLISEGMLPSVYLDAVDERITSYRHAVPRAGVLERFGMLGFCVRRWGLTISMTRFVHFGSLPGELEERFRAVAEVNARLMGATRAGVSSDALFSVARSAFLDVGYPGEETLHHQGGATGYAEREWLARPGGEEQVQALQAFAWNPNLRGAKVEDTVLLRGGVLEVLTETPQLPVVTTMWEGQAYRSAGVLPG